MNSTTVEALKDVYRELGGNVAGIANLHTDAEVIEALSALVGSTIELPAVTAEDDGDVLTVVNGAWSKAEPSGGLPEVTSADEGDVLTVNSSGEWVAEPPSASGGNVEIVSATVSGTNVTLSLAENEIWSLIESGKHVIIRASDNTLTMEFILSYVFNSDIYFMQVVRANDASTIYRRIKLVKNHTTKTTTYTEKVISDPA